MSVESFEANRIKLQHAVDTLTRFLNEPVNTDRDRAGIIQAFEFSFDLAWKCLQSLARSEGMQIASPRRAFSYAYQAGWIQNEPEWLKIMTDRNLTTHSYNEQLASEIYIRIRNNHIQFFHKLCESLANTTGL